MMTSAIPEKPARSIIGRGLLALTGVLLVWVGDLLTGYEMGFSIFYLIPVSGAAWWIGRRSALIISALSSLASVLSDCISGQNYAHTALLLWDLFIKFAFFIVVSELLLRLQDSLGREKAMARTDPLTGLANRRAFEETATLEVERLKRYHRTFTVAMIDLDHFKEMNDTQGHEVGDRILKTVAKTLMSKLRTTDFPTRLSGDEFVVLFPETGEKEARQFIPELHRRLDQAMKDANWPVTFSIGATTFHHPPKDVATMLNEPDRLMYKVKESGRNGIAYGHH